MDFLRKRESYFGNLHRIYTLLHPMIQHIVKALRMFAKGYSKPLHCIEIIVE